MKKLRLGAFFGDMNQFHRAKMAVEFSFFYVRESDNTVYGGVEGVVPSAFDIDACVEFRAALADEDASLRRALTLEHFYAESFAL